ncbi:MAG: hypothetical protein GY739_21130, partial [Mesoflavibacter sp.]|nr:hypothetical protein [Mesoflavibacter sp.]
YDTTHQQLFTQHLIEICFNINNYKNQFWSLIAGANRFSKKHNRFEYKRIKFDINLNRYKLYREFIAQTVRWIHYTYRVNKKEITPFSLKTYHWMQNTNDLMYHIRCDTIKDYFHFENKLRDDDIIVATDSGRDLNNGLTGIGIFIKDRDIFHRYSEPIGKISNNFGELFAIGKSDFCLKQFDIDTNNRRVIVMTDSLCNFCPLISPPKNIDKQLKFPSLFKQTQRFLKNLKAILWKIKITY